MTCRGPQGATMVFADRRDAGRRLAAHMEHLAKERPLVLGLPRGGVPVAYEIARALAAPLDVLVVRKLGAPGQPELAMGAIASGVRVLNDRIIRELRITPDQLARVEQKEREELDRRLRLYRGERPFPDVRDRTVVLVDNGIATGSTAMAGVELLRAQHAKRIVLAIPVVPASSVPRFQQVVDELVYVEAPTRFAAVGQFYRDFSQTSDEEVAQLLQAAPEAR